MQDFGIISFSVPPWIAARPEGHGDARKNRPKKTGFSAS
jgi:hypothetical protein